MATLKDKLGRQIPKLWKELYDQFRRQGDSKTLAKLKAHEFAAGKAQK